MTIKQMRNLVDAMRKRIPYGQSVAQDSEDFAFLAQWAGAELRKADAKRGLFAGLKRGLTFEWVNGRLAGFGWKVGRDGKMVQVVVPELVAEAVLEKAREKSLWEMDDRDLRAMGTTGLRERVRRGIAATGYVIDPETGNKLAPHERARWGL